MSVKAKVGHRRTSPRGLGYLTVVFLVVAALIIGAGHDPLSQFMQSVFSNAAPPQAITPMPASDVILAATPNSIDANHIESVIHEQAGITVLTVTVADSVRIEYLLNLQHEGTRVEEIHSKNLLAMICAIRKSGPTRRPIVFAGVGRFIDELDEHLLRSRVETKLSTLSFNRIGCSSDIVANDIDWNTMSDYHRSFPILPGLRVSD